MDRWIRTRKTAVYSLVQKTGGWRLEKHIEVTGSFVHMCPILPIQRAENIYQLSPSSAPCFWFSVALDFAF